MATWNVLFVFPTFFSWLCCESSCIMCFLPLETLKPEMHKSLHVYVLMAIVGKTRMRRHALRMGELNLNLQGNQTLLHATNLSYFHCTLHILKTWQSGLAKLCKPIMMQGFQILMKILPYCQSPQVSQHWHIRKWRHMGTISKLMMNILISLLLLIVVLHLFFNNPKRMRTTC